MVCPIMTSLTGHDVIFADTNECLTNNGWCAHTCSDTDGSYICSCRDGFTLASNGHDCDGESIDVVKIKMTLR